MFALKPNIEIFGDYLKKIMVDNIMNETELLTIKCFLTAFESRKHFNVNECKLTLNSI